MGIGQGLIILRKGHGLKVGHQNTPEHQFSLGKHQVRMIVVRSLDDTSHFIPSSPPLSSYYRAVYEVSRIDRGALNCHEESKSSPSKGYSSGETLDLCQQSLL